MKNIFYTLILSCFISLSASAQHKWEKSPDNTWKVQKDKAVISYKIDTDYLVYSSTDGKKWTAVEKNMWTDFEGNVYRTIDKLFFVSKDGGATWDNTPDATWHGGDGKWYKFDENWGVWVSQQ